MSFGIEGAYLLVAANDVGGVEAAAEEGLSLSEELAGEDDDHVRSIAVLWEEKK